MKKYIFGGMLFVGILVSPVLIQAQTASLSSSQISAIISLLQAFGADQTTVSNVQLALSGGTPTSVPTTGNTASSASSGASCISLSNNLYVDVSDATTDGEVSRLQKFLGGRVTGYFGPATLQLVQSWQAANGVVSAGSADTTGYGYVGPKTRAALAQGCNDGQQPTVTTPQQATTPSIMVDVDGGYLLNIVYRNLPNAKIYLIENNNQKGIYGISEITIVSGTGATEFNAKDTPSGKYYISASAWGGNTSGQVARSNVFDIVKSDTNVQTNSVAINSFSASPTTITAGQAVMFIWSSNLTQTDTSYYGGGCSIEGLTQNNVALQVTPGFVSGGTVTYVPPATATYTLRCSSGAKDGSPNASRQITVNVNSVQTNPVVISSFTASPTSVTSGQWITLSWSSNLTNNDIAVQGGGCGISALTSYNQQIHLTSGSTSGASGSVTYTPSATATYTLTCSSGGKDGSPMDTKQVTVDTKQMTIPLN